MSSIFEIIARDIEQLDELSFMDFMNHLLYAEAEKIGIFPDKVVTNLKTKEPDAGIDARIEKSIELGNRWIPSGLSVWQFKSSDIKPNKIKKEFNKSGVQEAIKQGGTYCIAIGEDYGDKSRKRREGKLLKCFYGVGPSPKFFSASDIARCASEHPPLALLQYFNRPIGDLMRFDIWKDQSIHQIPFQMEDTRRQIINKIREIIAISSPTNIIRIEGLPGVGKTRLVLESLRATSLIEQVLYSVSPSDVPMGFFNWVEHNPNIRTILVIDECDTEKNRQLKQHAERSFGRIKLITIGQEERAYTSSVPEGVFILSRLDDETIEKIVKEMFAGIPNEAISFIKRVSSGYVKLATELARAYQRHPKMLSATDMSREYDVQNILRSLIPEENKRKAMKTISLLTRVGWEGDLSSEGQALAEFMEMRWGELQDIVEEMKKSGLLVKQGRFRYVTPHLLAVWLASEVWDSRGDSIFELIAKLPTDSSRRAFLERLADLGDNEKARRVIEKLLSEEGIFPDLESIDSSERANIFSIFSESAPNAGGHALERIISHLPRDRLLLFDRGRREIIWTLEKLAWLPETFFCAARILLTLAEAENESYGNNATGIWAGLFRTHLGGTSVPALDRHILIKEALESESEYKKILALKGLDAALSIQESRMSSGEIQRGRIVPAEWHPKTYEEDRNVRISALKLLDVVLKDQNKQISDEAIKVLLDSVFGLSSFGLADEIIERIEKIDILSDPQRFEMRNKLEALLEYEGSSLNEKHKERIGKIVEKLIGGTFQDRLKRWVGRRTHSDWSEEGRLRTIEQIKKLAKEANENPDLIYTEVDWLESREAENVWIFSFNLGVLDNSKKLLPKLKELALQKKGLVLLSGYLFGRHESGESEWREDLLDRWINEEPNLAEAIFDATWRGTPSPRSAKRILSLIEKKTIEARNLRVLMIGGWTDSLPSDFVGEIIKYLVQTNDNLAAESALAILHGWLDKNPEKASELSSIAWKIIEIPLDFAKGTMSDYQWGKIAEYFIDKEPVKVATAILALFQNRDRFFFRDDNIIRLLEKATSKNPETVWQEVAAILLKKGEKGRFNLSMTLRGWYGNLFNADFLIEWAKKYPEEGPKIVTNITNVGGANLSDLARSLLINFPDNNDVKARLRGALLSGTFWGSQASWLEGKLKNVISWMKDPNPIIQRWAGDLAERIERDIKKAKLAEEEEDIWNS